VRSTIQEMTFEILTVDGRPIGSIMCSGLGLGPPPPGAPLAATATVNGNWAIVGGTGAFLGARGQLSGARTANLVPVRLASMVESPANRRINRGGQTRVLAHVIPFSRPQIVTTSEGPAVFHSDFSPVNLENPAKAGEVLIMRATGLGPTRPGVDPDQSFSFDAVHVVNSPIDVTVDGMRAEVLSAVGEPGFTDTYRVTFRVPETTQQGFSTFQITAAWIPSAPTRLLVVPR